MLFSHDSSGGWSCVPVAELDAWFRAHSHADAVNGPPPASSSDLAAIARRFVGSQGTPPRLDARASVGETGVETETEESERSAISVSVSFERNDEEARTPTGASSRFLGFGADDAIGGPSPEPAATSVDDLVDRAVARANAFSDAQVRAFGEACAQSRWCAVDALSGDEVRFFSVFRVFDGSLLVGAFRSCAFAVGTFSPFLSVVGTFYWPQTKAPRGVSGDLLANGE